MGVTDELLCSIDIPRFVLVKQKFDPTHIKPSNLPFIIREQLSLPGIIDKIQQGQRIGITAGSRGIANIPIILKEIINLVKSAGATPYIIPCMGSHGGAIAEGQVKVLEHLRITQKSVGAEILSSMEVVKIGQTRTGKDVYVDKNAAAMDSIVVVNRVKAHTAFRGEVESGIHKMMVIGLGKQKGADDCHKEGFEVMNTNILDYSDVIFEKLNIAFAVAIIENAFDQTYDCVALRTDEIRTREPLLLKLAKSKMPRLCINDIDVLIIDEIGKNISGAGMDTNITGRFPLSNMKSDMKIDRIVVLDLTKETNGNGHGIGFADFTTRRCVNKIDLETTYLNGLTNTVTGPDKIPMMMENDCLAIKAAIKTCNRIDKENIRIIRIKNTLELNSIFISESLIESVKNNSSVQIVSDLQNFTFKNGYFDDRV